MVSKLLPVVLAGLGSLAALRAQPKPLFVRDRKFETRVEFHGVAPIWGGRAMLGVEGESQSRAPLLYVVDEHGMREEFLFSIPGSSLVAINGIAHGEDGTIALCGWATTDSATGTTYLAVIPADRKRQTVIRTFPYLPNEVALAPDGTIWAAGKMLNSDRTRVVADNVFRRYERSGRLLRSWSVPAKGARGMTDATPGSRLMASRDRIGWLATGGEYFEFSLDGMQTAHFDPAPGVDFNVSFGQPLHLVGAALRQGNRLLLNTCANDLCQLLTLNRENHAWEQAGPQEQGWRTLIGYDGEEPVVRSPAPNGFAPIWHYKRNAPQAR